jgi:hypothetical protein
MKAVFNCREETKKGLGAIKDFLRKLKTCLHTDAGTTYAEQTLVDVNGGQTGSDWLLGLYRAVNIDFSP